MNSIQTSRPDLAPAELCCQSCYSFLSAASHPDELVARAAALGYGALALTDECSLAGVVKAHVAARELGLKLLIGSLFRLVDGGELVVLACNRVGYAALSGSITRARRRAPKGEYRLWREDLDALEHCLLLWLCDDEDDEAALAALRPRRFAGRLWLGVNLRRDGRDRRRRAWVRAAARRWRLPIAAVGRVLMHRRARKPLLDVLHCIREGSTLAQAGLSLQANAERCLRPLSELAALYPAEWLEETTRIAARCEFSLDELRYEYPDELVPSGYSATAWLRRLVRDGLRWRWPEGAPTAVRERIEHELALIAELGYEPYFLTVHDLVRFARERGILCQGRGSAANSAVCFCLGITEVDPARMELLFERFLSRERNEPPDIDVDFEHHRREEVIQYLYAKYGRERAALAASVITYRRRSALRDLGGVLGLARDQLEHLSAHVAWWDQPEQLPARLREAGFDPDNPLIAHLLRLLPELLGMPRHLSQHVGGFVISRGPLHELVPIENAAMAGRSVIQWDKNDLEALGLLKIDVLALGMLSAIRRAFALLESFSGERLSMAGVPAEDPAVYAMIQRAETIGVFQIESRAQMAMLPRLRPAAFYDLVIEVAIVRPGPIQGDMVHPYLRRRQGLEAVDYPSEEVRGILGRTLGVPIFQEQVMKVAMVAAGFSAGEADQLRRSMAAWRRRGGLEGFRRRLIDGMCARGYPRAFAERIYRQILGFGEYGFPESHAASFALLVYVSAWLKCHRPAAFFAALLNSQPMGFYGVAQLVAEARRQGVEVRPVDVCHSHWECTLERDRRGRAALRLGLSRLRGLSRAGARRLLAARREHPFRDLADLQRRAVLERRDLRALAAADTLRALTGNRHQSHWKAAGIEPQLPLFGATAMAPADAPLPPPDAATELRADYASTGLSLRAHPLALLRERLAALGLRDSAGLASAPDGAFVKTAGLVINRQRPGSAGKVMFLTLEDEQGHINLVVWSRVVERWRAALLGATLLSVSGRLQREGGVVHLVVSRARDLSLLLEGLRVSSRDFH